MRVPSLNEIFESAFELSDTQVKMYGGGEQLWQQWHDRHKNYNIPDFCLGDIMIIL